MIEKPNDPGIFTSDNSLYNATNILRIGKTKMVLKKLGDNINIIRIYE